MRVGALPVRDVASAGLRSRQRVALTVSVVRRRDGVAAFPPNLDLIAPIIGAIGLVAAGVQAGDPVLLSVVRTLVGAAFLGSVSDAMLLGHWYLVQPGLARGPLLEMVRWVRHRVAARGRGISGPRAWCPCSTVRSTTATPGSSAGSGWRARSRRSCWWSSRAALRHVAYSAVMAATGLLYLAILTAFGTDLIARAVLAR